MSHVLARLAVAVGGIANYCDHAEHLEELNRDWVTDGAREIRHQAFVVAAGTDLRARFEEYVAYSSTHPSSNIGSSLTAWRNELARYDADQYPDVVGRSRYEQLRYHALKAAVLLGCVDDRDNSDRDLAIDLLLLGLRLSTVMREGSVPE